jgi:hypothetical protein
LGIGSWLVVTAIATAACGKKGPPLPPLLPIPAAIEQISAARLGNDVYVSLTLPMANVDEFTPADLARVEVYGYTGRSAPQRGRFVELATLVGTIEVAPPPLKPGETAQPEAEPVEVGAPKQGAQVTIRDALTPDELVQGRLPPAAVRQPQSAPRDSEAAIRDPQAEKRAALEPLKRFYAAVPFNWRGRPGPPGGVAEFALMAVPEAPPDLRAQYTDRAVLLSWEPAGGLLGFLLERTLAEETLPFVEADEGEVAGAEPPGPLAYYVYREVLPDPSTPPGPREQPWQAQAPSPISGVPVAALAFADTAEFGRRRCYTVRAVRGIGPTARVGSVSPEACVTPVDTFSPTPPQSIVTVASEGVISLIWEPGGDTDVGGYIVLRGEAPGGSLQPLTPAAIRETGFRDETVTPGNRYVYAVIAVDNRFPVPNMSPASSPVEETAR